MEKKILHARPSLRTILPVVFWQTAVYSALNVLIAVGLLTWVPITNTFPVVAPNQIWIKLWGVLFLFVGVALLWGLIRKQWERLRGIMCIGLFYKIVWSIALVLRVGDGGTFLIAAPFIGLAALQTVCIVFYLPPDEAVDGNAT